MVHCAKCKAVNDGSTELCASCGRPLLKKGGLFGKPQHSAYAERARRHLDLDAEQAVSDFTRALESAPEKERGTLLGERASALEKVERYEEARADLASAAELVKPVSRPDLLLHLAELDERLGAVDDATRDRLAYTYAASDSDYLKQRFDPDKMKKGFGEALFGEGFQQGMVSAKRTQFAQEMEALRRAMCAEGKLNAVGWCRVCKAAVELTAELRCPNVPTEASTRKEKRAQHEHEKAVKRMLYVMPDEVERGVAEVAAHH